MGALSTKQPSSSQRLSLPGRCRTFSTFQHEQRTDRDALDGSEGPCQCGWRGWMRLDQGSCGIINYWICMSRERWCGSIITLQIAICALARWAADAWQTDPLSFAVLSRPKAACTFQQSSKFFAITTNSFIRLQWCWWNLIQAFPLHSRPCLGIKPQRACVSTGSSNACSLDQWGLSR